MANSVGVRCPRDFAPRRGDGLGIVDGSDDAFLRLMGREKFGDADTVRRLVRKCHELDLAHVLVSYQASTALGGPIYIARVIRMADGALLALRTGPAQGGAVALRPLLARAIADGLQAAANHPLR